LTAAAVVAAVGYSTEKTVIKPRKGFANLDFGELWRFRDLLYLLTLRSIKIRYKQSVLGVAWALIKPFVQMVVFSVFIGTLLGVGRRVDVPYPIFLYAGLLPWLFFQSTVTTSTHSLVQNAAMMRKVYFPRILMPLATIGAPLMDYLIGFTLMGGLMWYYGVALTPQLLLVIPLILTTVIAGIGIGIFCSAWTAIYRDVGFLVPYFVQLMFYATPVMYPGNIVGPEYADLLPLNPMYGIISTFRACIFGEPIDFHAWFMSVKFALLFFILGVVMFHRLERRLADVI
jgi:lipopolysaccharide transport system permease protein